jgi:hypothetical protein
MHRTLGVWDSRFYELSLGVEGQLGKTLDSCKGVNSIKESPKHYRLLFIFTIVYTHGAQLAKGLCLSGVRTRPMDGVVIRFGRRVPRPISLCSRYKTKIHNKIST